jgi:hypothetical protein
MTTIDFTGYEEEDVLQTLIDTAIPLNVVYKSLPKLPKEMLAALITRNEIQYYNGRMLGVSFKQFPLIDATKYDKHNGEDTMLRVLNILYERAVI